MAVRGIRGATALTADDRAEMDQAVLELMREMFARNRIDRDQLISILFTATPDLHCGFPAASARQLELGDVPLMCAQELDITGAMPRVVRVLAHIDTDTPRSAINHVYLRGTEALRQDLAN